MNKIIDEILSFQHVEQLITRRAALLFAVVATGLGFWTLAGIESWSSPVRVAAIAACPLAAVLLWYGTREIYLRSGRGRKIAVVYEGHRVPLDDWIWTRRELAKLFANDAVDRQVSLRLIPARFCARPERLLRIQTRYRFGSVLRVTASRRDGTEVPHFSFNFTSQIKARLMNDFLNATVESTRWLIPRPLQTKNVVEALGFHANNLFDLLLLYVAFAESCEGRMDTAARLLEVLDNRIAGKFKPDQEPRHALRWMRCRCLLSPSRFGGGAPPGPDLLAHAVAMCDLAIVAYSAQFPEVHHTQARNLFFVGRIDDAIPHAMRAFENGRSPEGKGIAELDLAVLDLMQSNFSSSREHFANCISGQVFKVLSIDDLVAFADCAYDMGHVNAVYIRGLYRGLRGDTDLPNDLLSEFTAWLHADGSRAGLRVLVDKNSKILKKRKR